MIENGVIETKSGRYRIVSTPDLAAAWAGVRHLESQQAQVEQLWVDGKLAIERITAVQTDPTEGK